MAKLVALALCTDAACAAPARPVDLALPVQIDLAPGSLQQALEHLAELTQLQILYDPDLLRGLTTQGLHGKLTPAKALERLLASTDLSFEFTAKDAVALRGKTHASSGPGEASPLPPAQVHTVTISTDRNKESVYDSAATFSTVKIDESSLLVPFSTASLPQELLRDQQANRLEDVAELVSGVEIVPDGQSASGFEIRGFPTYQYYLDGVRVSPDLHHDGFRDLADIDSVEILKGPASLLYGRTEPGGAINVMTKQPLEAPMLSLEQQTGSFGRNGTLLDAGGPLSPQGSFLYRLNVAWESDGSFRDISDSHRIFLSPVVTWRSSPRAETTLYLEYLNSHDPSDSGLPLVGNRPPPVPVSRSVEEGGDIHTRDLRVGTRGSYTFDNGWILRHHEDARWIQAPQAPQLALAADGLEAIQCSVNACPVVRELVSIPTARGYTSYASTELARELSIWRTRHSLMAGLDFFQTEAYTELEAATAFDLTTDLFHPHATPLPLSLFQAPHDQNSRNVHERWGAAYIQDQVAFLDKFYLLVSLRYDYAWEGIGQAGFAPLTEVAAPYAVDNTRVHAATKRTGFVWHPTTSLSLYVKYTENFGAAPGLYVAANLDTGLFVPEQSAVEYEAGAKLEFAAGRAAATLAVFDLKKDNIASALLEPALDPNGELYLTGSARNTGVELDVHGEITPGLKVLANYAFTRSKIDNYTPGPYILYETAPSELIGYTGNRLFGVPRNGGSAWGSYQFADPTLRGLKLGAGVIARGAREGDNLNDYQLPGFTRWNTFAAYNWRAWGTHMSVQLNVDNVFNKRYFESVNGTYTVMPGAPRQWLGSYRVQF